MSILRKDHVALSNLRVKGPYIYTKIQYKHISIYISVIKNALDIFLVILLIAIGREQSFSLV